jgi:hypothetical protein
LNGERPSTIAALLQLIGLCARKNSTFYSFASAFA